MEVLRTIKEATSFENAIEIIPKYLCDIGESALESQFRRDFPSQDKVSVVPILESGRGLGQKFTKSPNFMRMSYYDENNNMLDRPRCLQLPEFSQIVVRDENGLWVVNDVAFTEVVVDSQDTVIEAMKIINHGVQARSHNLGIFLPNPQYYTYTLISKINGDCKIPNFRRAFDVDDRIWVFGRGCDWKKTAREVNRIMGTLSPFAIGTPKPPYFKPSQLTCSFMA